VADASTVTVAEIQVGLAWNIRGDPLRATFVATTERLLKLALPVQPSTSVKANGTALLWLGPRSWLFTAAGPSDAIDFDAARRALNAESGALFDVSSSYVAWTVEGNAAARVLNSLCPLDFHPGAFPAGHCAQSVLGHVNALFYRPDERAAFVVMVSRSFAEDAWDTLGVCAKTDGFRVSRQ
jgi:sarcosine oxidase subunit gamma